ncbi:MAG: hypothetical protein ACRDP1_09280 [Nocardioidaceae bacterium]
MRPIFESLVHRGRCGVKEKGVIQVGLAVGALFGWCNHHVATVRAVEGSASEGMRGPEARELAVFETIALLCLNGMAMSVIEARLLPHRSLREAVVAFHGMCEGLAGVELRGRVSADLDPEHLWRESFAALLTDFNT